MCHINVFDLYEAISRVVPALNEQRLERVGRVPVRQPVSNSAEAHAEVVAAHVAHNIERPPSRTHTHSTALADRYDVQQRVTAHIRTVANAGTLCDRQLRLLCSQLIPNDERQKSDAERRG